MKKSLLAFALVFVGQAALADHSIQDAMSQKPSIKKAVESVVKTSGLNCALTSSMQMKPTLAAKENTDIWRQVAVCFTDAKSVETFNKANSNQFGGVYGVNGAALLDVTYDLQSGQLFEISLK